MAENHNLDLVRLYHLNSSRIRSKQPEPIDYERQPFVRRTYLGAHRIDLPGRDFELPVSLGSALSQRRSRREFQPNTLKLELLGRLLYASYGVTHKYVEAGHFATLRSSPSAGGLCPLELYLVAQQIEGLADGIYHYDSWGHQLEQLREGAFHEKLAGMMIGQPYLSQANLVVCITAVFERETWKYGERGYRYVLLEAGHVCQNLYLVAAALGLSAVSVGGFFDHEVNRLLCLPEGEEDTVYLCCIGLPGESSVNNPPSDPDEAL